MFLNLHHGHIIEQASNTNDTIEVITVSLVIALLPEQTILGTLLVVLPNCSFEATTRYICNNIHRQATETAGLSYK